MVISENEFPHSRVLLSYSGINVACQKSYKIFRISRVTKQELSPKPQTHGDICCSCGSFYRPWLPDKQSKPTLSFKRKSFLAYVVFGLQCTKIVPRIVKMLKGQRQKDERISRDVGLAQGK